MLHRVPNPAVYAMSGVERSGASRTAAHSAKVFVSINGVQRAFNRPDTTGKILIDSLRITERRDATPSTAALTAMGFPVTAHDEVIITLGSVNNSERQFAGTVLASSQQFAGKPASPTYALRLIDYTWQLNRIKVIGRYSGSASSIVTTLMGLYAPDWSLVLVEAGLPTIDEITFVEPVDLSTALTRVAARVPFCRWKGNYDKQLFFGVTDPITLTNPQPLTASNPTLVMDGFGPIERDSSQLITRVHMEGGGSEALTTVAVGETILPLRDAPSTWYGDVGGVVVSGPQRISYTARVAGGGGSLVGTGAAPASAPVLALAAGAGVTAGSHDVAVVYVTAAGKSLPGPKATIVVGSVLAPASAPVAGAPTSGTGPDPGAHYYAISEVTAAGETTPSPVSNTVTTVAGTSNPTSFNSGGTNTRNVVDFPDNTLTAGATYTYKHTYRRATDNAETAPSSSTSVGPINAGDNIIYFTASAINAAPSGYVVVLYRSKNAGAYQECTDVRTTGPAAGFYIDCTADANVGQTIPAANGTEKRSIPLTDLVPASSLGTSRKLYGTAAAGSQLKLVASLNTTDTTYLVTTIDSALGANAPTSNTAAAAQITTSAPLGPTSTTAREFYMSLITGGARKLALTISDNTTIAGTLTASDATLTAAAAEPSSDTSGLAQPAGQVLAGATSIPVASLGGVDGFKATGGWAVVGNGQIVVRYTGLTGNTLTGIPATGVGSITATVAHNSQITAAPALLLGRRVIATSHAVYGGYGGLRSSGNFTRMGQLLTLPSAETITTVTLNLHRANAPVGSIWVTLQTGFIGPSGTVLATSALIDAATIAVTDADVTFTFPATSLPTGALFVVLHGDYAISASNNIAWASNSNWTGGVVYNGTVESDAGVAFVVSMLGPSLPILYTIQKGDAVNVWVTENNTAAQAALSAQLDPTNARLGAAGIIEDVMQDRRLSRVEARARAQARLTKRSTATLGLHYQTYDKNTHPSGTVVANLVSPTSLNDTLTVQEVSLTFQDANPPIFPLRDVQAAPDLFTFEQVVS